MRHNLSTADPEARALERPSFAEALRVWLRIGLLGFGGPAGQIAFMHRVLVEEKRWVNEARFLTGLNFCMLLPGPEAQQLATYVGWTLHGVRGGVAAGTLFVLPGFLVLLAFSTIYVLHGSARWVGDLFFGLKAAVLAIVIEAVIKVGRRALKTRVHWLISLVAFAAIYALGVPFPLIVLGAGLAGALVGRFMAAQSDSNSGAAKTEWPVNEEPPQGGWRRALGVVGVWGALWVAPVAPLIAIFGSTSIYPEIAAFFSKMAVVTFGGAYAVLAYVAQEAAGPLAWLTPAEMLDGLAMAETTPGPLILVLVFVGFLAGFRDPGGIAPLAGGLAGAALTAWVTFVPCFLWIFLGAPYVAAIERNRALSSALAAITAAVVGVILNLAAWFALHTLFGEVSILRAGPLTFAWPDWTSLNLSALALGVLAMAALFVLRLGMIGTLAISAAAGMLIRWWP